MRHNSSLFEKFGSHGEGGGFDRNNDGAGEALSKGIRYGSICEISRSGGVCVGFGYDWGLGRNQLTRLGIRDIRRKRSGRSWEQEKLLG